MFKLDFDLFHQSGRPAMHSSMEKWQEVIILGGAPWS